jgi:hypothetical protein
MKGQAAMLLTNLYMIVLYNVVDHAFSGFIAAKLPFSLFRGTLLLTCTHLSRL